MSKNKKSEFLPLAGYVTVVFLLFGNLADCSHVPVQGEARLPDGHWRPYEESRVWLSDDEIDVTSFYIPMRDGVEIAADLYLPRNRTDGQQFPTILQQTRYFRSWSVRWPFDERRVPKSIKRFLANGYAWVKIDVRGTGASFGKRIGPWSPDEVKDGGEVLDWIVQQHWSNGIVGATGGSYAGTSAEMLILNHHPALEAVAPRFSLFDVGYDISFPGGIHLSWFTKTWTRHNEVLDANAVQELKKGWRFKWFAKGVRPVDRDPEGHLLKRAVEGHRDNYKPHSVAQSITFRDDVWPPAPELNWAVFSPHGHIGTLRDSGIPIYSYSGWCDGAYPHAAIKRFLNVRTPGSRMILGPWTHGGRYHCSPFLNGRSAFDHDGELLRFFDDHLKGADTGIREEPLVRYYTMGEERWKTSDVWPPAGATKKTFYLSPGNRLSGRKPRMADQWDAYQVDYTTGTGPNSRWNTLITNGPVYYADRREKDEKLLVYESDPLEQDMEVTGHPIATLYVKSTESDGQIFLYLEDVDEQGEVRYVTEGMLRAIHRKVSPEPPFYESPVPFHSGKRKDAMPLIRGQIAEIQFDLLPVSYLFKKGHALRVAIAGADRDHFVVPAYPAPSFVFTAIPNIPRALNCP